MFSYLICRTQYLVSIKSIIRICQLLRVYERNIDNTQIDGQIWLRRQRTFCVHLCNLCRVFEIFKCYKLYESVNVPSNLVSDYKTYFKSFVDKTLIYKVAIIFLKICLFTYKYKGTHLLRQRDTNAHIQVGILFICHPSNVYRDTCGKF